MSTLICCVCQEGKDSLAALESHICMYHLLWLPYECVFCRKNDISFTRKPTEAELKLHFDHIHPDKPFTILFVPDDQKKAELKEHIERSKEMSGEKELMANQGHSSLGVNEDELNSLSTTVEMGNPSHIAPSKKSSQINTVHQRSPPISAWPSKPWTKFRCLQCDCSMSNCYVRRHLATHHLKKMALRCSACSYGCKWSIADINLHILRLHNGQNVKIIDTRSLHEAEMKRLKSQLIVREENSVQTSTEKATTDLLLISQENSNHRNDSLNNNVETGVACGIVNAKLEKSKKSSWKNSHRHSQKLESKKARTFRCLQCQRRMTRAQITYHLATHHLKKITLRCSACSHVCKWAMDIRVVGWRMGGGNSPPPIWSIPPSFPPRRGGPIC